jgi:hypothetical protein
MVVSSLKNRRTPETMRIDSRIKASPTLPWLFIQVTLGVGRVLSHTCDALHKLRVNLTCVTKLTKWEGTLIPLTFLLTVFKHSIFRQLLIGFVSGKLRHLFISALSVRVHHPAYLIKRYTLIFNFIIPYSYILFVTEPVIRYTLHSCTC